MLEEAEEEEAEEEEEENDDDDGFSKRHKPLGISKRRLHLISSASSGGRWREREGEGAEPGPVTSPAQPIAMRNDANLRLRCRLLTNWRQKQQQQKQIDKKEKIMIRIKKPEYVRLRNSQNLILQLIIKSRRGRRMRREILATAMRIIRCARQ